MSRLNKTLVLTFFNFNVFEWQLAFAINVLHLETNGIQQGSDSATSVELHEYSVGVNYRYPGKAIWV